MTRKYRPSNGTEGEWFMEEWCGRCQIKGICKIWPQTFLYHITDPEYPSQWIYDENGAPICVSFRDAGEVRRQRRESGRCDETMPLPFDNPTLRPGVEKER